MKSAIHCDGKILIVGDGDFSFTVALMKHSEFNPHQVYTSNLESETSILHHVQALENTTSLKDQGVFVFLETDARDLHNHPVISKERFDRIVFNFPLADRHNIKKNRSLLADFFLSCRSVLTSKGRVLVTLCKGQGGTPADQPVRSWHDSWQIVAMATNASFLLREVLPFDPAYFPEYHSVGFRFQDKSFNVTGALTHVFETGTLIEDCDFNMRGTVHWDGISYSCANYVASRINRNLLEEPGNPVNILRQDLEERLKTCPSAKSLIIETGCNPIIPHHKSMAYFCIEDHLVMGTRDETKNCSDKDWKNCENVRKMTKAQQLAHGVENGVMSSDSDSIENAVGSSPCDRENVFILVKSKVSTMINQTSSGVKQLHQGEMEVDKDLTSEEKNGDKCFNFSNEIRSDCNDTSKAVGNQGCGDCFGPRWSPQMSSTYQEFENGAGCANSYSLIYHWRTSLLENLLHLSQVLDEKEMAKGNNEENSASILMDEDASTTIGNCEDESSFHKLTSTHITNQPDEEISLPNIPSSSFPCLVTSGQCMLPCHIIPNASPARHEMLVLHQIAKKRKDNLSQGSFIDNTHQPQSEFISSDIISLLHNLCNDNNPQGSIFDFSLSAVSKDSVLYQVDVEGIHTSQLVGQIFVTRSKKTKDSACYNSFEFSEFVGFILNAGIGERFYHVTVIDLQRLVCLMCGIGDWRLLWSTSEHFLNQFQTKDFSLHSPYRPFSLFPMKFVHDLSFWEQDEKNSGFMFDVFSLYESIRNVAGDLVVNVSLIDVYKDPDTKRKSRCYRLHFMSSDKCLPYVTSWKLQSKIRMEVARNLGVQLR